MEIFNRQIKIVSSIIVCLAESVIKFAERRFTVREPELSGETRILSIPVIRVGDTSKVAIVRVHTRDGTAKAGRDYVGFSNGLY